MIHALIFDFDGLILDTETPEFRSWQEIYAGYGCTLSSADWTTCVGKGRAAITFNPYEDLERQWQAPLDREAIRAGRRRRYSELVGAETILPGVEEYLSDARELSLRFAVASSSPRSWVTEHLARLGLLDRFECIRCAEDVQETKPHPDLYLSVLRALQLRPSEAVAFEDSPNGVLAARAAGIFTVGVPNALTRGLALQADLQLASLAEMPLPELLSKVDAEKQR
jgi:HAD superfamily hydrolase (TIGR01509 family)